MKPVINEVVAMAWELIKVEDQRKQLVELYYDGEMSMTEICAHFGISRKTGYKWLARHESFGDQGLKDLPRAPKAPNRIYSSWHIEKAIELKSKRLRWGARKVIAALKRQYPKENWPSESRLQEIFGERGLVRKRRYRRKVPATHPLSHVFHANDVWAADFKGWWRTVNGEKCEPFTVTDSHTRFVICCLHMGKKTADNVWAVLERAFQEYGLPKRLRTDNGPPFGSVAAGRLTKLSVNLIKAGVTPEWIEPGHPEENGRHERFHLTLKENVALPPAQNLSSQVRQMNEFVQEYNYDRPHEALDMRTPADCYSASNRSWDGLLRSPEYDTACGDVRKVTPAGTIWVSGTEIYVGQSLTGEYVQLKGDNPECKPIYYGPVLLGDYVGKKSLQRVRQIQ